MSAREGVHTPQTLDKVPDSVVTGGAPATGRYSGSADVVDWSGLKGIFRRSALWRILHHKRWHYVGVATEQCFIGLAVVDVGWTNTAFAYLFDRVQKTLLVDYARDGLPLLTAHVSDRPTHGARTWFKHLGAHIEFAHHQGAGYRLTVDLRDQLKIEAELDIRTAAPWMTAIGPVHNGGCAHCTVKSSAMGITGQAYAGGKTFSLSPGVASFDYSNGLLARNTQWRWASAHSDSLGFNLQQGFFCGYENMLWLHGVMIPLGAAHFEFDPLQPLTPWHIYTDDGLLDLWFYPEGARQARKNLLVAASYYVQPIGTFRGWVKTAADGAAHPVKDLLGVTEDHQSHW